jgi:hypothetical protein
MAKKKQDVNQRARSIVDIATGEVEKPEGKDPAAVSLGRKGGQARAKSLSAAKRKAIAKKAAQRRWKTRGQ